MNSVESARPQTKTGRKRAVPGRWWWRLALGVTLIPASGAGIAAPTPPTQILSHLLAHLLAAQCSEAGAGAGIPKSLKVQIALSTREPLVRRGQQLGERLVYTHTPVDGHIETIRIHRIAPDGTLRRAIGVYETFAPDGKTVRPLLWASTDHQCRVLQARRLEYGAGGDASWISRLDPDLQTVQARFPLDAPVPASPTPSSPVPTSPAPSSSVPTSPMPAPLVTTAESDVPTAVRVALVDSGVNYELAHINHRLARDEQGRLVGYDFWDMDDRPFDSHPRRSPFFPERHGTQTAGVLLADAPVAKLVPYRYPRPDMSRMGALVQHAVAHGVKVMNLSLGGPRREQWNSFLEAARENSALLFVVSAGNGGHDVDAAPVYPAALSAPNLITVTSSLSHGQLAERVNWGLESVDVSVPGEERITIDFYGLPKLVSGSSYAAARVSALAACLVAANPGWDGVRLKAEILALAKAHPQARTRVGYLSDPTATRRGSCQAEPRTATVVHEQTLGTAGSKSPSHGLHLHSHIVQGSGWRRDNVKKALKEAAGILSQCGFEVELTLRMVEAPRRQHFIRDDYSTELVSDLDPPRPSVFFVADTLWGEAFDAVSIGRSNARRRPGLLDTIWLTARVQDPGIALAHEIMHVLSNSGNHDPNPANLMHEATRRDNRSLRVDQCDRAKHVGGAFGLLTPIQ